MAKDTKATKETLQKVSVYFQMENEQSEQVFKRLENIASVTGMSLSALSGLAVRMAITQLEEALIEPEQLLKSKKKVGARQVDRKPLG